MIMKKEKRSIYSKSIKLGPAVGDWTKINLTQPFFEEGQISSVKNTNFDSLAKEDLSYLHFLHYRLAERMAEKFSADMRIKVEMHTILANQMTYSEFLETQQDQVIQSNYIISKLGRVNVIFDWDLADMIVNRLSGGKGEVSNIKQFSEVEASILEAQMESLLPHFQESWTHLFDKEDVFLEFSIGDYVQDRCISLREAYIVFSFYLYFGKGDLRRVVWGYPNYILRALLKRHKQRPHLISPTISLDDKVSRSLRFPVSVELGKTTLSMNELNSLQVGDVVVLDSHFKDLLKINISNVTTVFGQPGVVGSRMCMQIVGTQTEEDDRNDEDVASDDFESSRFDSTDFQKVSISTPSSSGNDSDISELVSDEVQDAEEVLAASERDEVPPELETTSGDETDMTSFLPEDIAPSEESDLDVPADPEGDDNFEKAALFTQPNLDEPERPLQETSEAELNSDSELFEPASHDNPELEAGISADEDSVEDVADDRIEDFSWDDLDDDPVEEK